MKDEPGADRARASPGRNRTDKGIKCFNCHRYGHMSMNCPDKANFYCGDRLGRSVVRVGKVEGAVVSDLVLDTGCSGTMVRRDLVLEENLLPGEAVTVLCAHGDALLYLLAYVDMEVEGMQLRMKAAIAKELLVAALLGTDIPQLGELLRMNTQTRNTNTMNHAMVVTRAQAEREKEEAELQRQQTERSGVRPREVEALDGGDGRAEEMERENESGSEKDEETEGNGIVEVRDNGGEEVVGGEFADDLFESIATRKQQTRKEKREKRRTYGLERAKDRPARDRQGIEYPNIAATEMKELQNTDETLATVVEGNEVFRIEGVLYRCWVPRGQPEECGVDQIILPKKLRRVVLQTAHSIPLGGHLGRRKTAARIIRRFYWPTLFRDVADFCRSCDRCQKAGHKRASRAPMIPLPIIEEPFQRIAMDIVGPLPRSCAGHRYVLVVCDYATRYPEAIPMEIVDAESVADELVNMFARVRIPQEILTDQGTNFTSQLLAEIYRLLHVDALRTSPYHPQTDGLVERFNGTLKEMLKKTASADGKDWDKLLPYVLFAYWEVPQESTGFSPFELLYGREVRVHWTY